MCVSSSCLLFWCLSYLIFKNGDHTSIYLPHMVVVKIEFEKTFKNMPGTKARNSSRRESVARQALFGSIWFSD